MSLLPAAPTGLPRYLDAVLAFGAAAVGPEPDSLGYVIFGASVHYTDNPPLTVLDWGLDQLSGATLAGWAPTIYERVEELAQATKARAGFLTLEPTGIGEIIYQRTSALYSVDLMRNEKILAMDMAQRAVAASGHVYGELVKLGPGACKKTTYKGKTRNHLTSQVGAFGVGQRPDSAGALLIAFCNGVLELFDSDAMRRRTSHTLWMPAA